MNLSILSKHYFIESVNIVSNVVFIKYTPPTIAGDQSEKTCKCL